MQWCDNLISESLNIVNATVNLIRMYYPHRSRELNLMQSKQTFEEIFLSRKKIIIENMSRYETLSQDLDDALQQLQQVYKMSGLK